MAGIYVHIPFCKTRCKYCAFFSTTELQQRSLYTDLLIKEYALREDYLPKHETIRTIYLGGGTPSQLGNNDLARLLRTLPVEQAEEVTMEVNPSDVTEEKLRLWLELGVNRLSIGVQSFNDETLTLLGRRHDSRQALRAIRMAQAEGMKNISIDLMYAVPGQTMEAWQQDVTTALTLDVQHISTYCLSYEAGTPFTALRDKGALTEIDDDQANEMYAYLCERMKQAGYNHYEVSNFALPGYESKHNSSYWDGTPYIGLGAGAHSFDGVSRQWNVENLKRYIRGIVNSKIPATREKLNATELYNERVMLGLRTSHGIEATDELLQKAAPYIATGKLVVSKGQLIATIAGINILNTIITDLMRDDEKDSLEEKIDNVENEITNE